MDGLTQYLNPTRCPWPCGFVTIGSVIVILAAIKYLVQLVRQFLAKSD